MKLHFLGTGAADWDPKQASKEKDFRRVSSLLIDDQLLIDPGPCIFEFTETFECPHLFDGLKTVINTHKHWDHFNPDSLARLALPLTEVENFSTVETEAYRITAYPANHATVQNPQHFVIESKSTGKRIFYGCDGAWLLYPVWRELKTQHFDAMIFDCTIGDIPGDYRIFEHNNIQMVEVMTQTFAPYSDRFFVSHMARTLHTDHETLKKRLSGAGITPAYDNMVAEI